MCGPTLEPARLTSPFTAPANLDLTALKLTPLVVLPHHDRAGRAARHREAAQAFRSDVALTPLSDDEVLLVGEPGVGVRADEDVGGSADEDVGGSADEDVGGSADDWHLMRGGCRTRTATRRDAVAVMEVFHAAASAAWADFLGAERLLAAATTADPSEWSARIDQGGDRFLVTEDAAGLCGFVLYRRVPGGHPDRATGEVDLLYTHPRVWREGIGRRLLNRATWSLYCLGCDEAVLWTEARNERALAVYQANGWRADGAVSRRDYLGVPIRNLRHRLDLTRYAGGA